MSKHRQEVALLSSIFIDGPNNDPGKETVRKLVSDEFSGTEVQATISSDKIKERVDRWVRSPEFLKAIDAMVRDHAKAIVVEVLAEKDTELEGAVRRIVGERWDTEVSRVATELLTAKLADLKRRLT